MIKRIVLSIVLMASVAQASVKELVPKLSSANLNVQTQAQLDLLAVCSHAGRPGAEDERLAVCAEMVQLLKSGVSDDVATQLVRNLQRIGGAESVPMLVKIYGNSKQHLSDEARQALAVNPSPEAGQALQAQLKMRKIRSGRETAGLFEALGERRETGASVLIVAGLGSKDDQVFFAAVKALSRLNENSGIRAMAKQRKRERGFRKTELDAALFETDHPMVFEKLYAESESDDVRAVALLGLAVNGNLKQATKAMASGNVALQSAVIEAALQSKSAPLYDLVAQKLSGLIPALQIQAMGVLQFSGNRGYAKAVEPLLSADDVRRKDAAAQALALIGTAQSVPALLSSGTGESRNALGVLNADGVDDMLKKEVSKKGDGARRAAAIQALSNRGQRELIPQFFVYAGDDDSLVAQTAVSAIGTIGDLSNLDELTELMISKASSPLSRDILKAIVEVMRRSTDQDKAVAILVARMDGASLRSQASILQALGQVGTMQALAPILEACASSDEKLQKQAFKVLGEWKTDAAISAMIELAGDPSLPLSNHVLVMRGVSRLLAGQRRLDEPLAIEALNACRRPDEKKLILGAFAKAKGPEAKAAVEACLSDKELQADAEAVLKKMK